MENSDVRTERAAASPASFVLNEARKRAADFAGESLQREILARLMVGEFNQLAQQKTLDAMKGYLLFFVVLTVLNLLLAVVAVL